MCTACTTSGRVSESSRCCLHVLLKVGEARAAVIGFGQPGPWYIDRLRHRYEDAFGERGLGSESWCVRAWRDQ